MASKVDEFDEVFPTLVRYVGLLCTVVLIGFCLAGHTDRASPGFVPAAGMILYKTVRKAASKIEGQATGEGSDAEE